MKEIRERKLKKNSNERKKEWKREEELQRKGETIDSILSVRMKEKK